MNIIVFLGIYCNILLWEMKNIRIRNDLLKYIREPEGWLLWINQ